MTLNRQFGLLPERGDELRSALHRLESVACEGAYFADSVQTKIGQLALLHVAPDVLDRVEFRRVSGQSLQDEVPVERFNVVLDDPDAVRWQAVPDDQQFAESPWSALVACLSRVGPPQVFDSLIQEQEKEPVFVLRDMFSSQKGTL